MPTLQAGDPAPKFSLASTEGQTSLDDLRGNWLVLYFYPRDHTPGCTTQACDLRDAMPGLGASVLGVSSDDLGSHERFREDYSLPFPLLSDPDHETAKAYGAYGEKTSFGKTTQGTIRSSFIIDPEGKIAEAMYNVKVDGHAEALAKRLKALKR